MPMVLERLKNLGMTRYEIDRGVALDQFQQALGTEGPGIMADIPNFTDIQFQMQISQSA